MSSKQDVNTQINDIMGDLLFMVSTINKLIFLCQELKERLRAKQVCKSKQQQRGIKNAGRNKAVSQSS